jgi:hypothetical protein
MHLLAHAVLAGGAVWVLADAARGSDSVFSISMLAIAVGFSLVALLGECFTAPPTDDARRAIHMILGKSFGMWFWGVGVAAGHLIPLLLLATGKSWLGALAAVLALIGMGVIEWLWVSVPQKIPLS